MSASLSPPLGVSRLTARRFARRVLGLDTPFADVAGAIAHHGYIQIDPINVCGRMHDLILRNRVAGYCEGDLMRYLHEAPAPGAAPAGSKRATPDATAEAPLRSSASRRTPAARAAFEHHLPDSGVLVAFPLEAWPHLLATMQARTKRTGAWSGRLTPRERELAPQLLAEIAARGPLGSEDFADSRRAHRVVWGAASLVKSTLQKLFFHGRVLIAERVHNRRRYDLPERVLPQAVLAQPAANAADTTRWLALLKVRQRRLVMLKREEVRAIADAVQPVAVEGCPLLYMLRTDVGILDAIAQENEIDKVATPLPTVAASTPGLLAPLDPLIYDRRVTAALWDFDYTWEVYTPPAKRVRGYYALPILAGTEIVGHVDPKADRTAQKLRVVSRRLRRGHQVAPTLRAFSRWLGF